MTFFTELEKPILKSQSNPEQKEHLTFDLRIYQRLKMAQWGAVDQGWIPSIYTKARCGGPYLNLTSTNIQHKHTHTHVHAHTCQSASFGSLTKNSSLK